MKGYIPLIWLLLSTCGVLLFDLYRPNGKPWAFRLAAISLLGVFVFYLFFYQESYQSLREPHFHFLINAWTLKLSLWVVLLSLFVLLQSEAGILEEKLPLPEYIALFLFSVMGILVLVSAGSLLTLYLGLELMSLPLYAMIALSEKTETAYEASMKYFVLGVIASGFILYGFSLAYGLTGTLNLHEIAQKIPAAAPDVAPVALLASVFVLAGLGFKFGLVPFHMWLPDVYEGAPAVVVLFLSTIPKLAIFAFVFKIMLVWPVSMALRHDLSLILLFLGVISVGVGNILALAQTAIRRLLAYSAIAHTGFLFLAFMVWFSSGADQMFANVPSFYILSYVFMSLSAFGLVLYVSERYGLSQLVDFKGLYREHPWVAFLILITFFSLAGVPPTLGFYAKFYVIGSLIRLHHYVPAALVLLFSVIGAFYYLKVIWYVYFSDAEKPFIAAQRAALPHHSTRALQQVLISVQALSLLCFGLFPSSLIEWLAFV